MTSRDTGIVAFTDPQPREMAGWSDSFVTAVVDHIESLSFQEMVAESVLWFADFVI